MKRGGLKRKQMPQQSYRPTWDISTIPDDLLLSEAGRRRSAMRKTHGGGGFHGKGGRTISCLCGACKTCLRRASMGLESQADLSVYAGVS